MKRSLRAFALTCALTAGVGAAGAADAAASTGGTGAAAVDHGTFVVTAANRARVAAKQQMVHNLQAGDPELQGVDRTKAGLRAGAGIRGVGASLTAPSAAETRHVLHYEGSGNGNKGYTCGPSASRNVIESLIGKDYGEATFEKWEATSPQTGTSSVNIAAALETHFGHIDTWSTIAPTSPSNLYANVKVIVGSYHHGTVQNVRTNYLPFWNGHATNHFNAAVGYTASSVTVGEEWAPAKIGVVSNYGQPYGFHAVSPTDDYNAVHNAPSGKFIG